MALPLPVLGTYSAFQRGAYWEVALHAVAFEGGMKLLNSLDAWKISRSGAMSYNYGLGHGKGISKWKSPSTIDKIGRSVGVAAMNPSLVAAAVIAPTFIVGGVALNEKTRQRIGSRFFTTPFTSGFGTVV